MDSNLCFHPLVGTLDIWYCISVKKDDKNFDGDKEKKKINKLFNKFNLASEGWEPFKCKIVKATLWSDYLLYLVKEVLIMLLIIFMLYFLKKCLQRHFQFLKRIRKMVSSENLLFPLTKIVSG